MSNNARADAPWQPVRNYLECVQRAVNTWRDFLVTKEFDWMSPDDMVAWCDSFDTSLRTLRDQLFYDEHLALEVRTTRSGLPCHNHVRELANLHDQLVGKEDDLRELQRLRQEQLDHIFKTGSCSLPLLRKLSVRSLYDQLRVSEPLRLFQWRGVQPLRSSNGLPAYQCAWESYTAQPLPVRYVMVFETTEDWKPYGPDLESLRGTLDHETRGLPKLGHLANDLDRAYARVHPKWIARVVLGPLFVSHLTTDDHQLQQVLDSTASTGEYLSASRIIYEYVLSEGEQPMSRLVDSERRPHQKLQKYGVRLTGEHGKRRVTHLEKHLFAPHQVIQLLDDTYRKEIGHQLNGV